MDACESDLGRRIAGRPVTVAEQLAIERPLLRALPAPFDATESTTVRVDAKALVTVRQNRYSVPVALGRAAGHSPRSARPRSGSRTAIVRSLGTSGCTANTAPARVLDHYLELLARKPGGLARSLPLAQERDRGAWPATLRRALGRAARAVG